MVLADTLAFAVREHPGLVIDFATLTGACVNAITERYSGAFTNRVELEGAIVRAGRASGERVWPFPLDDDFDEPLESQIADVRQCLIENEGDHILAARFLRRFAGEETPWIHLDLASARRKGGLAHIPTDITGFGVRYTLALLLDEDWGRTLPLRGTRASAASTPS
jgi:leucyl aminopeptidase